MSEEPSVIGSCLRSREATNKNKTLSEAALNERNDTRELQLNS